MTNTRHRFFIYSIMGLIFGILDWFYLDWLAHVSWGSLGQSSLMIAVIIILNYGIWLVPIVPVVFYESRAASRIIFPVLAGMLTWSCAIFSYYFYYASLLSLGKLPHLEHLNIFGDKYPAFWYEYWQMFKGIIIGQFFEWVIIAVLGGATLGAFSFWISRKKSKIKLTSA